MLLGLSLAIEHLLSTTTGSARAHISSASQFWTTLPHKSFFSRTMFRHKESTWLYALISGVLSDISCGRGSYRPAPHRYIFILLFFPYFGRATRKGIFGNWCYKISRIRERERSGVGVKEGRFVLVFRCEFICEPIRIIIK